MKLDDKGQKCVFLGVSGSSKAYKMFDHVTRIFIVSKDVIFMRNKVGIGRCAMMRKQVMYW